MHRSVAQPAGGIMYHWVRILPVLAGGPICAPIDILVSLVLIFLSCHSWLVCSTAVCLIYDRAWFVVVIGSVKSLSLGLW